MEAPIPVTDIIQSIIPSDVLPPSLTPLGDAKRSTSGHFLRVGGEGSDTYIFWFEKPIPATQAKLIDHFFYSHKMVPTVVKLPDCKVEDGYAKYNVPRNFVPKSEANKLFIAKIRQNESIITDAITDAMQSGSPDVVFRAMVARMKSVIVDDEDDDDDDDEQALLNQHLVKWVRKTYGDHFEITSNECLLEWSKLTIHQTSRPDFTLIPKFTPFSAISVTIDDDEYDDDEYDDDEYDELIGIAGECNMKENKKAKALANMVFVAGVLVYRALLQKKKFYKIKVYGLMCNYSLGSAHLLCLTLNFQTRESNITEYSTSQDIGYQFAAAFSLLRKDPISA